MKLSPCLLTFCFVLIGTVAYSQQDTAFLSRAVGSVEKQNARHPTEKVYLHLDKPHYAIGDTIWFKAYTVIGQHRLSALSGILYTELINQKDSVVKRLTLPLIAGIGWGDFTLLRSYQPGSYHVRAYTNYMRNTGTEYFFNQRIQVGGLQLSLAQAKQTTALNPDVQFFPEGSQLVNGVRSRVAIKAVNNNGLGEDIKGTIEDNEGNIVADFSTQHLGMGVFAFTPQNGKTYKAKISSTGEAGFTVDLPKAEDEGYTLALNNSRPDSIYIKVAVNEKVFNEQKNSIFYIVAQSCGKVYYTSQGKLAGLVYTAKVDKDRFPSGVAQFTLFSQSGEPLAERVAFIQNNDTLKLNLAAPSATYTTRQQVKIELNAKNANNIPVTGSFSVAAINESRVGVNEDAENTILNNLLLTSDLKGYIEQPNYYFTNVNDETKADLDLLMLTQGYRSFEWKQVLNNTGPSIAYQPERSLELTGTLKTPSGNPVPNGKVTLVATKQNMLRDTVTDINGNFKFTDLYLPDTAKLVLRARKAHNGSNVAIFVKQPDYPAILKEKTADAMPGLSPEIAAVMQKDYEEYQKQNKTDSLKNGIKLKEVTIKGRQVSKPDVYNHYGTVPEYDVDMKRLAADFIQIKQSLIFVIPGIISGKSHFYYEDPLRLRPVQFIIDGFERTADDLNNYTPNEIESIRMINWTGLANPTVILTTKRYAGTDTASTVKLKQVTIQGKKINKAPDLSRSSNLHGGGNADQVIMGKDLGLSLNLADCLEGKVTGVTFSQNGSPLNIRYRYAPMSVIVDGNILPPELLNDINPNDVYSIEVLRTGAAMSVYGTSIKGGALVVTLKRGVEDNGQPPTDTTVLKQVNVTSKKINKNPELTNSDNLNGPGNADQVIMGDKIEGCITLSDCLNGKVFGVRFDQNGVPHSIRLDQGRFTAPPPMVIIVDGNIMDGNHLNDLNASDIYSIEVLRSGAYLAVYGSNASGGALVITTKRGGENNYITSETPAGLITYPFKGFYKARTFYSPKYNGPKTETQSPDLRNTIYWNPNIITDKNGKASFEYFNNDTKGVYRLVVEGIDTNGNLGRQVLKYKVE